MSNNEAVFQIGIGFVFVVCCWLLYWLAGFFNMAGMWRWVITIMGGSLLTVAVVALIFWFAFNQKK